MPTGEATYNITDDKIRVSFYSKLPDEDYQKVRKAGFAYWRGSKLFVAKWSTYAEDLLKEWGIEIEEDETPDDVEARVDRFSRYADNAQRSSDAAFTQADGIASHIPFGQPILVGHHSERHARADAKRIENGMRKGIAEADRASYWKRRIASAIAHAERKERPDVIARRIKGLEADERKFERHLSPQKKAEMMVSLWHDEKYQMSKQYQAEQGEHWTAEGEESWLKSQVEVLRARVREIFEPRWRGHESWAQRNLEHVKMRLEYERAMYEASGGMRADQLKFEVGGAIRFWDGWREIVKVNQKTITARSEYSWNNKVPFDKIRDSMSKEDWQKRKAEAEGMKQTMEQPK